MKKQTFMISIILHFRKRAQHAVSAGVSADKIGKLKVRESISRMKEIKEDEVDKAEPKLKSEIDSEFNALLKEYQQGEAV